MKDPRTFLAFGFGSGMSRWFPGTMGTAVAIPFLLLIAPYGIYWLCALIVVSTIVGVHLCGYAAKQLGVHDHSGIVWDEFVGLWITFIAVPISWQTVLVGFLLFRFFDMVKPWPIGAIDRRVHGGLGIMLDDIIAAAFSLSGMHLLLYTGWL